MTNSLYNRMMNPAPGTIVRSASLINEFNAVAAGFLKVETDLAIFPSATAVTFGSVDTPAIGVNAPGTGKFTALEVTGNVGVGTAVPSAKLEVSSSLDAAVSALVSNPTLTPNAAAQVVLSSSNTTFRLTAYSSGHAVRSNTVWANVQEAGKSLVFGTVNTERARISAEGQFQMLSTGYANTLPSNSGSIIFANKTQTNTYNEVSGGIFADTYRDVANPHYTAGIWFNRIPKSGGITSGSDIIFGTSSTNSANTLPSEKMRITESGHVKISSSLETGSSVYVGTAGTFSGAVSQLSILYPGTTTAYGISLKPVTDNTTAIAFINAAGSLQVGGINVTSGTTSYTTASDHRLKLNQAPLQNSGAFIDALKPKTWTWADGSLGTGFIAHEFQEVSPSSVTGTKDEVDAEGRPKYQSMQASSSEVIANIVAELQSVRARITALEQA